MNTQNQNSVCKSQAKWLQAFLRAYCLPCPHLCTPEIPDDPRCWAREIQNSSMAGIYLSCKGLDKLLRLWSLGDLSCQRWERETSTALVRKVPTGPWSKSLSLRCCSWGPRGALGWKRLGSLQVTEAMLSKETESGDPGLYSPLLPDHWPWGKQFCFAIHCDIPPESRSKRPNHRGLKP